MIDQDKTGGPAFPSDNEVHVGDFGVMGHSGMSLRDWFAGQALAGILAGGFADTVPHDDISGGREASFFAYLYADAMIAERNK